MPPCHKLPPLHSLRALHTNPQQTLELRTRAERKMFREECRQDAAWDYPELLGGRSKDNRNELAWRLGSEKRSETPCQIPNLSSFQEVGLH